MKRGIKKIFVYFALFLGILMISGVFAETIGISDNLKEIISNVAEKQGVNKESINSIEKVDFENLPSQIELDSIDTTNLAIYEVKYGEEKPVFVITASSELIESSQKPTTIYRDLLNFGLAGKSSESAFLETANGIATSHEKGYVMMRKGSVTGMSTNVEILSGEGAIEIVLYINGKPSSFSNTITASSTGVKKDYDVQSMGVINFKKGDVISAYVKVEGEVVFKEVINLIEISTE